MRAYSHWELAQYLVSFRLPSCTAAERDAFLFGSIEPDLNCTTYLKGFLHGSGVHGHNYEQVLPRIDRLLHELTDKGSVHLLDWYWLGKLTHFIARCVHLSAQQLLPRRSAGAHEVRTAACGSVPVGAVRHGCGANAADRL